MFMSIVGISPSLGHHAWGRMYQSNPENSYDQLNFTNFCQDINLYETNGKDEDAYSAPMVLIGIYISIASLICILAMALDLLSGLRERKLWFPTKYFSLNAASVTVIAVAMKLPVDLTSSMSSDLEQVAKLGSLAFMCTVMSNLMPSLASMDNTSLLANVTGLSILVITLIVNMFIQIRTHLIGPRNNYGSAKIAYIYIGMLLFLLIILISSAITLPTSKKVLELKFKANKKKVLSNQNPQEHPTDRLRQAAKRYWIMAETGSPQFVMVSNPLSSASGIICAICMIINIIVFWWRIISRHTWWGWYTWISILSEQESVYKWSIIFIVITQIIGIIVGSIAPIFRCFTVYRFKSFADHKRDHFYVFKVENYWTKRLCEWKVSPISFSSRGGRSRVLLHNLKTFILSFCIVFQKIVVVSCKIIGLIPIVVILFVVYCSSCFKSVKAMLFIPPTTAIIDDGENADLSEYVLLLEDNMRLAKRTMKGILDSMSRLIKKAEKKQHNNLLKLLEKSVAFDGVVTFDTDQVQSLLPVEHVNSWSLPVISLTCIAIALPNINKDKADNLVRTVGEGLLYTHLVEECLNMESAYVNAQRATKSLWPETEDNYKWLGTNLKRSAYEEMMPAEIVKKFAHMAEDKLNEFKSSGEPMEMENLPPNIIFASSMYRIAQTIIHTYESKDLKITEEELFTRISGMIADILAACLTNIPRVIEMRCQESVIEKREASVKGAVDLLGRTTHIIKILEKRVPNMNPDKMGFIDEWRLHFKQP